MKHNHTLSRTHKDRRACSGCPYVEPRSARTGQLSGLERLLAPVAPVEVPTDLNRLLVNELKTLAVKLGCTHIKARMRKAELISAINSRQANSLLMG